MPKLKNISGAVQRVPGLGKIGPDEIVQAPVATLAIPSVRASIRLKQLQVVKTPPKKTTDD